MTQDPKSMREAPVAHSLNEIEVQSIKAARGAGLPWGIAEEAGKAARWLAGRGLPAIDILLGALDLIDGRPYADLVPVLDGGRWVSAKGPLCPLLAGITLCDRAEAIAGGESFETGPLAFPVLVTPFAAAARHATGTVLNLEWPGATIGFDGDGMHVAPEADLRAATADRLACEAASDAPAGKTIANKIAGVPVDPAAWARLGAYAQRTYVPASDASRERGAGAGLDDND